MQEAKTLNNHMAEMNTNVAPLPFPYKPDFTKEDIEEMPPQRIPKVELTPSSNGNLERWKFAFQVIAVVLGIILALGTFGFFVWTTGVERGIEKERMRMIEVRQQEEAVKKEREERIRVDRLEDKANAYDELQKQQEQNQKRGK